MGEIPPATAQKMSHAERHPSHTRGAMCSRVHSCAQSSSTQHSRLMNLQPPLYLTIPLAVPFGRRHAGALAKMLRPSAGWAVWVLLVLAPGMLLAQSLPAGFSKKPNVLFVVFDDLNTRLGCYGDPVAKSPHIDRLAAQGTVFTQNFCQLPICGPSRASFMSGRRPDALGIWSMTRFLYDIHPDAVTMPQWFMQHGYTAMSIGKVLGGYGKEADFKKLSVTDRRTGGKTKDDFALSSAEALPPNLANDPLCENRDVPDEACFDTVSTTLAIAELKTLAQKREPFFLALGIFKPHTPYKIPKRYWDLYRREEIPDVEIPNRPANAPELAFHPNHEILGEPTKRRVLSQDAIREVRHGYYAAMSYADAQLGRVLDALESLELRQNTIVVVIGDNGFHLGEHDTWGKMTLFGPSSRVPLIISAPGAGTAGAKTASISELIDLFPTLNELCGLGQPRAIDGTSLVPVLKDPLAKVKDAALTQYPRPALYWGAGPAATPQVMGYGLFNGRWTYNEWRDFTTGSIVAQELYDARDDPHQTQNLVGTLKGSTQIPSLAQQLRGIQPAAAR